MINTTKTVAVLGAALGALLLGSSAAFANTNSIFLEVGPQYGESNVNQYGDGGEFTALAPSLGVPDGYSPLATATIPNGYPGAGQTGFETFCVEDEVDFYVGQTYYFTEGLAIQQQGAINTLTEGVAWLYSQFAEGTLQGYDYSADSAHLTDAGELQSVLWFLQDEPVDNNVFPNPDQSNPQDPFLTLVENHFGGGLLGLAAAQVAATDSTDFGVQVLELTSGPDGTGSIAQDQLVYTGAPDSAATIGLLGLSVAALALFKRRSAMLTA